MRTILKYFPHLTSHQIELLSRLEEIYVAWNEKINVISRKNMNYFYTHHVLHSLAIAKVINFKPDAQVMDLGTGGGFPGIPLAIIFPNTHFILVDSIAKKMKVVRHVIEDLAIENTTAICDRAENVSQQVDFVVTRAVAQLSECMRWTQHSIHTHHKHSIANGLLCLKGGDLTEELSVVRNPTQIFPVAKFFDEPFFQTKLVVHVAVENELKMS